MTTDAAQQSRPPLTTHILDIQSGKPAQGVEVALTLSGAESFPLAEGSQIVVRGVTDGDGRVGKWSEAFELPLGEHLIEFEVGKWFEAQGISTLYPKVSINFCVEDSSHYHIPLLLSAYGYSTYRGS